jgi:hypothetical protein
MSAITVDATELFAFGRRMSGGEAVVRIATYREIRSIVEHTEREEAVALFNLQLIHFD